MVLNKKNYINDQYVRDAVYNIQSHRFQKLDEILQDQIVAATMALSLLVRRCVKPLCHISIKLGTQLETNMSVASQLR